MKTAKIILIILFSYFLLPKANPVYIPEVYIKNFSFNEEMKWEMVLSVNMDIDSLKLFSSTDFANYFHKIEGKGEDVVLRDSEKFTSEFNVNPVGDSVTVNCFFENYAGVSDSITEVFIFGNYRGATMPRPLQGQSITKINESEVGKEYFCLKDQNGKMYGEITGQVFDQNDEPVNSGTFALDGYITGIRCSDGYIDSRRAFEVDSEGNYSISLYALNYQKNQLDVCAKNSISDECVFFNMIKSIAIEPLDFAVRPDTTIEMDIYLLEGYVSVEEPENLRVPALKIYPNPVGDGCVHYEVGIPVRSTNCSLRLIDMDGKTIMNKHISENKSSLHLPVNIGNGIYFFQLVVNGKTMDNRQIVVNK